MSELESSASNELNPSEKTQDANFKKWVERAERAINRLEGNTPKSVVKDLRNLFAKLVDDDHYNRISPADRVEQQGLIDRAIEEALTSAGSKAIAEMPRKKEKKLRREQAPEIIPPIEAEATLTPPILRESSEMATKPPTAEPTPAPTEQTEEAPPKEENPATETMAELKDDQAKADRRELEQTRVEIATAPVEPIKAPEAAKTIEEPKLTPRRESDQPSANWRRRELENIQEDKDLLLKLKGDLKFYRKAATSFAYTEREIINLLEQIRSGKISEEKTLGRAAEISRLVRRLYSNRDNPPPREVKSRPNAVRPKAQPKAEPQPESPMQPETPPQVAQEPAKTPEINIEAQEQAAGNARAEVAATPEPEAPKEEPPKPVREEQIKGEVAPAQEMPKEAAPAEEAKPAVAPPPPPPPPAPAEQRPLNLWEKTKALFGFGKKKRGAPKRSP